MNKQVLMTECALQAHLQAHRDNPGEYEEQVLTMLSHGIMLTPATKARAAAILWNSGSREAVDSMMEGGHMEVAELGGMLKLVDGPRLKRQLERKLERFRAQSTKPKKATLKQLEVQIARFEKEGMLPACGSGANSALMKRVQRWVRTLSADRLQFFLLNFPHKPWQDIADLVHLKPSDFALEDFLLIVHGKAAVPGTLLADVDDCNSVELLPELLRSHPTLRTCYSFLRKKFEGKLAGCVEAREAIAELAPLEDVVWFYEELAGDSYNTYGAYGHSKRGRSGRLESIVMGRIQSGESLDAGRGDSRLNYGKVMERLLMLKTRGHHRLSQALMPRAEALLRAMRIPCGKKVAVFGDASASMQVAINSATIVGSMLCACLDAELNFFDTSLVLPSVTPKTAADVLKVCEEVRAGNCTCNAASLWPYYAAKKRMDLFIMVTDEVENRECHGYRFCDLFRKYREEVNSEAKVFFVSFFSDTVTKGQMVAEFERKGLGDAYRQFRFDLKKPDLSKIPTLIGLLTAEVGVPLKKESSEDTSDAGADGEQRTVLGEVANKTESKTKASKLSAGAAVFKPSESLNAPAVPPMLLAAGSQDIYNLY